MSEKVLNRILYVEDEKDIQAVAQIALEAVGGFTMQICSDGEEALKVAEKFAPDLLLLDVMMPNLDGPATLSELKKIASLANTPAIFMTAKVQSHEVEELINLGAVAVIAKPFDPMALSSQIKEIWDKL